MTYRKRLDVMGKSASFVPTSGPRCQLAGRVDLPLGPELEDRQVKSQNSYNYKDNLLGLQVMLSCCQHDYELFVRLQFLEALR